MCDEKSIKVMMDEENEELEEEGMTSDAEELDFEEDEELDLEYVEEWDEELRVQRSPIWPPRRTTGTGNGELDVLYLWKELAETGHHLLTTPTRPWFRTGLPITLRCNCCHSLIRKGTLLDFYVLHKSTFYFTCMECYDRVTMEQDPWHLQQYVVKSGATVEPGDEEEQGQQNAKPTLLSWGRRPTFPYHRPLITRPLTCTNMLRKG